jgi:hypothetical protein
MKKVHLLVPQSNPHLKAWIEEMPELPLVADFSIHQIAWEQELSGNDHDWTSIAEDIAKEWGVADGFVIWAPEQSLLPLAGYLSMTYPHPGIPIILFSAPSPKNIRKNAIHQLGLKSILINAGYLAQSDIAEVLILSGSKVFRPDQCYWSEKKGDASIDSQEDPVAIIDFSLRIQKSHLSRAKKKPVIELPKALSQNIFLSHWYPGLSAQIQFPEAKPQAALIQADPYSFEHEQIKDLRKFAEREEIPLIWYSSHLWSDKERRKAELLVSHSQFWWVLLAVQYGFGLHQKTEDALSFIQDSVRKEV